MGVKFYFFLTRPITPDQDEPRAIGHNTARRRKAFVLQVAQQRLTPPCGFFRQVAFVGIDQFIQAEVDYIFVARLIA